jgi:ABC-2 type transport system permease protein
MFSCARPGVPCAKPLITKQNFLWEAALSADTLKIAGQSRLPQPNTIQERWKNMLYDTWLIFKRQILATWRSPIWTLIFLFEPVCLLIFFAPLLDKLVGIPGFETGNALSVFAPGLLIMLTIFGTAYSGYGVLYDLRFGVVERLRVTGISPVALAIGFALKDVVALLVQAGIVLGLALLMGLKASLGGVLLVLVLLIFMGIMLASFSYAFALTVKDESAMSSTISFLTAPLLLLSGVTLPLALAPAWLQTVALANPFYHAVEGSRSLVAGNFSSGNIWVAFGVAIVFAFLMLYWCSSSFGKATN